MIMEKKSDKNINRTISDTFSVIENPGCGNWCRIVSHLPLKCETERHRKCPCCGTVTFSHNQTTTAVSSFHVWNKCSPVNQVTWLRSVNQVMFVLDVGLCWVEVYTVGFSQTGHKAACSVRKGWSCSKPHADEPTKPLIAFNFNNDRSKPQMMAADPSWNLICFNWRSRKSQQHVLWVTF